MKTIDVGTRAMLDSRVWTNAWGMKLTRASDGNVSGWTGLDRAATVTVEGSPLLLSPVNGVDLSSIARTAGWGTDNLEITVVKFDDFMTKIDLLDGFWDASEFLLFQYDWATPANAIIPWLGGNFGKVKSKLGRTVIELHCHRRWLQQDTTPITQPNCWYEFGDPNTCRVDLAPHTYTGTVTTAGQRTFTASALAPAAGTLDEGKLVWTGGLNEGRVRKVRTHATGGVITLWDPMLLTVDVDDTFSVVAGCARTREACKANGNILNYPGFDQKGSADQYAGGGTVEA